VLRSVALHLLQGPGLQVADGDLVILKPERVQQNLSNSAWSFARLLITDVPFRSALAAESIRTISAFNSQNLANTPWACSKLE